MCWILDATNLVSIYEFKFVEDSRHLLQELKSFTHRLSLPYHVMARAFQAATELNKNDHDNHARFLGQLVVSEITHVSYDLLHV